MMRGTIVMKLTNKMMIDMGEEDGSDDGNDYDD